MRANTSSSIFASLTLHALVAVVIILTTMYVARSEADLPKIIELVAGPPTAPDQLVAPALGNTTMKVNIPKIELPPEPVQPEVTETVKTTPDPVVKETTPVKPEPVKTEAVKTPPVKAKSDTSIAKQMKQSAKVSYKDYLKKHPTPKPSTSTARAGQRPSNVPKVDVTGILGGVRGGSTANTRGGGGGKALTREETDQLSTYISLLIQELKKAHEPPPGVSDQLVTKVTFDITASGAILNPRITKSSGNREFDESVLDAFRRMRSIGPTPTRRPDTWTVNFKMQDDA